MRDPTSRAVSAAGACAAPHTGLYFRPDGYVAACCGGWQVLGQVTGPNRRSLREIWQGRPARELRAALDVGDFGLGCWECGAHAAADRREASLAVVFDRFAATASPDHPRVIDFALSNRCNLECVMCNGGLSSAIRAHREHRPPLPNAYDERFFEELEEFLPPLERALFKGGEPFLAPENRRIWDSFLRMGGTREVCVTTNGTIWNERVERYVRELGMEVILSVDAVDPATLEAIRVGVDADTLWRNVDRFQAATAAAGSEMTLSMCLMSTNWGELLPFLSESDRRGLEPKVIWVDGPAQFRLLGLPVEQLREVEHRWDADAAGAAALSPVAASLWTDARSQLRAAIESGAPGPGSEVTVAVAAPTVRRGSLLSTSRAELAARTDGDLLELAYVHEVIQEVHAPEWSRWLAPERWVGIGLDQTITELAAAADTTMRYEVESGELGVHRALITLGTEPRPTRLRVVYVPPVPESPGSSHILIGLDAQDVPGATAGAP